MRLPVVDWQHGTVTASCRCFEGSHGFSNVDKDEEWADKYSQDQERHYRREDSAENPPPDFVFKNPSSGFEYRDYTVKAGDAGYQKDEPQRNLNDPAVEINYQPGKHSAPSPDKPIAIHLKLPLSFFVPLRVLRDFVVRSRL
jgi:hypothetical protein